MVQSYMHVDQRVCMLLNSEECIAVQGGKYAQERIVQLVSHRTPIYSCVVLHTLISAICIGPNGMLKGLAS